MYLKDSDLLKQHNHMSDGGLLITNFVFFFNTYILLITSLVIIMSKLRAFVALHVETSHIKG